MTLSTPEIATRYGAIDSDAIADGEPTSAHVLRAMAISANRLLSVGETVLTLVWDSTVGASESAGSGMMKGYGWPFWTKVVAGPITVPKKPGLRTMECNVTAYVDGSNTVDFMMTTRRNRPHESRTGNVAGIMALTGDGSSDYLHHAMTGVPCAEDDFDELEFYVRGRPTTTLATSGTSSGTLTSATMERVTMTGASFHSSLPLAHVISFENGSSSEITTPRVIIGVSSGAEDLDIYPPLESPSLQAQVRTAPFKIHKLCAWRLCCINVNTEARTV